MAENTPTLRQIYRIVPEQLNMGRIALIDPSRLPVFGWRNLRVFREACEQVQIPVQRAELRQQVVDALRHYESQADDLPLFPDLRSPHHFVVDDQVVYYDGIRKRLFEGRVLYVEAGQVTAQLPFGTLSIGITSGYILLRSEKILLDTHANYIFHWAESAFPPADRQTFIGLLSPRSGDTGSPAPE